MAKKLYAVTNIKVDSETTIPAGEPIDSSKFTKDQLVQLHEDGAIVVKDDSEVDADEDGKATVTELVGPGQTDVDMSVEAVESGLPEGSKETE